MGGEEETTSLSIPHCCNGCIPNVKRRPLPCIYQNLPGGAFRGFGGPQVSFMGDTVDEEAGDPWNFVCEMHGVRAIPVAVYSASRGTSLYCKGQRSWI